MREFGAVALIIGYTIQGLAIARALRSSGVKVYALCQGARDSGHGLRHPVFYSDNATVFYAENLRADRLGAVLLSIRKKIPEEMVVLFPVTDNSVSAIATQWPDLQDKFLLSWADCRKEVERIVQKRNLPEICEEAGVSYPKTQVLKSKVDVERCLREMSLPILIKPNKQVFSFKAYRCSTADEFMNIVLSKQKDWPLIAQEWIDGDDSNLYFYTCFSDGKTPQFGFTGRKVRTSPPQLGIATILETIEAPDVRDAALKLLPVLNVCGPIAMEFKKDSRGAYRFIEANVGRMEFCVDLAIYAGFNLPLMEFNYTIGRPLPQVVNWRPSIWFDTDKEPFCYLALCLREGSFKPRGRTPVFPYFRRERLRVCVVAVFEAIRKFWARVHRKISGLSRIR